VPNNSTPPPFIPHENNAHFVRHLVTTLVLAIVAFLAGAYFVQLGLIPFFANEIPGTQTDSICIGSEASQLASKKAYDEGYKVAMDFARDRVSKLGHLLFNPHFLAATIKSIEGNKITVEFASSLLDLFGDGMTERTLIVNEDATIEKIEEKPEEQYAKESLTYDKALKAYQELAPKAAIGQHRPLMPSKVIIKKLSINDLKVGDTIDFSIEGSIQEDVPIEASTITPVPKGSALAPILPREKVEEAIIVPEPNGIPPEQAPANPDENKPPETTVVPPPASDLPIENIN